MSNNIFDVQNDSKEISSSSNDTMVKVKEATRKILDAIPMGEKTTMRDLIDHVVADTKVQVSIANGLVPMFAHEWANSGEGSIERGRSGGIFRGKKLRRIDPRPRCETCNQVLRIKK